MPGTQSLVNELATKLRKRKVEGSQETALLTAELLRTVISRMKVPQTDQAAALIEAVTSVGKQLIAANPVELAVGNIVRRVLHIIREDGFSHATNAHEGLAVSADVDIECPDELKGFQFQSTATLARGRVLLPHSLHTLLDELPDSAKAHHSSAMVDSFEGKGKSADRGTEWWEFKQAVIRAVKELIEEINICHEGIANEAVELIHQNEVILTFGRSRDVMEFLCAAKRKKKSFRVFVAEGAPNYQGHVLSKDLAARGLQTTVITDSAVFAIISRVNIVVVGVHAVMANGGVIGHVGLNMVALAAKKHCIPFVAFAGIYKLCPLYPQNPEILLNEMKSPAEILNFGEFSDVMDVGIGSCTPLLHVVNPAFDYVPPELVRLLITETGGHNPSFMHRLIADYYSADDMILQKKTAI